jgi:hypothetical protein
MGFKRRWTQWPGRTARELNGVAGVAGLGGVALGAGGLATVAGTAALALTGVGTAVVLAATGYAIYQAIPPVTKSPGDFVGGTVTLETLETVFPPIKSLAIVGISQAGKTTLKNRLSFDVAPIGRTQQIGAYIKSLETVPPSFLAVLDGSGDRFVQQFRIAEKCDFLCIVVDHNKSDIAESVDPKRIADQEHFLMQLRHHLDETKAPRKEWVRFLVNKRDLWRTSEPKQQELLAGFFDAEANRWRQGRYAALVDVKPHSNEAAADTSFFMDILKKSVVS